MLSPVLLTLTLLHGAALGNQLVGRDSCNHDNCLRAMIGTPSVASSFCSTWLQPTSYITITPTVTVSGATTIFPSVPTTTVGPVIPSHISSQCTLTTAPPLTFRLSSACSCITIAPAAGTVILTSYAPATTVTDVIGPPPCDGVVTPCTASNGVIFDEYSGTYYSGPIGPGGEGITDFPTCISSCAATTGCVAANFYTVQGEIVCQFITSIDTVYRIDTDGAVLASYNSNGQYTPSK
ncbi:hypothetical protein N431DRAFT_487701 [Stipitochalara longipes BDJ]|nr:hypothetical protein N431DRAFT_487701 [Stipitochalara longipes BDJ]